LAAVDIFASASSATDTIISQIVTSTASCSTLTKPTSIARAANRYRSKNRPRHPVSLDFDLLTDHIPDDFLVADIIKEDTRHLLFATSQQLQLLSNAKTW